MIFRLGRIKDDEAKGPGLFFLLPCIDQFVAVDIRTKSFDVPPQRVSVWRRRRRGTPSVCVCVFVCLDPHQGQRDGQRGRHSPVPDPGPGRLHQVHQQRGQRHPPPRPDHPEEHSRRPHPHRDPQLQGHHPEPDVCKCRIIYSTNFYWPMLIFDA